LLFGAINDVVEEVDITTGDISESVILLSGEKDFGNGSYETSLSESSKMSTYIYIYIYINSNIPYLNFV